MKSLLQAATAGHYAVGSFNVANLEMMETVIRVAADCRAPVIVSTSSAEARYFDPAVAYSLAQALAAKYNTPIALHLDHGDSFEMAMQCIRAGYTSVMFDGSHHPLAENIRITKAVVQAAHAVGVSVEGEVGRIQGVEDDLTVSENEAALSNVGEATHFAQETGVDALAVAIGNAHGFYKQAPQLDLNRLQIIREKTGLPIVLHGGTGIPADQIQQAIRLGVAKINVASRVRRVFMQAILTALAAEPTTTDVREVMGAGKAAMATEIRVRMELLGSLRKLDIVDPLIASP